MAKPNLIIDTTSLLGASRLGSVPAQACQWAHKYYNIVHSRETLDERLDVAARPRIQQVFGRQPLYDMIKAFADRSIFIENTHHLDPLPADPADTKFLELALSTGARCMISSDKDIRDLKHLSLGHAGTIQIWTPAQFLQIERAAELRKIQTRRAMMTHRS